MENLLGNMQRDSAFRLPDWRWRRAEELNSRARVTDRRLDDDAIARARQYIAESSTSGDKHDRLDLECKWGTLHEAYFLHSEKLTIRRRHELEARLLTGESLEHVAKKMMLSLDIVRWYEALFFNVSDRLDNVSWIVNQVMPVTVHTGMGNGDYELIWKMFAYGGGEHVLEAAMLGFMGPRPKHADGARGFFRDRARHKMDMTNCVNMYTMQFPNTHTKIAFSELHTKYMDLEQKRQEGSEESLIREHLEAALRALPLSIGLRGRTIEGVGGKIHDIPYRIGGMELRDRELLAVHAGATVILDETMPPPVYPEKAKQETPDS
jgi:hypothetical protein